MKTYEVEMGHYCIKKIVSAAFICAALVSAPCLAVADEADEQHKHTNAWFVEGRYQKSISESSGFKDKATSNRRIVSATGEKWDNLDSVDIAIGKSFDDGKLTLSLGYENFGTVNKTYATATQQNGTVERNVTLPMDITNMVVEFGYNMPITESFFAVGLLDLGKPR